MQRSHIKVWEKKRTNFIGQKVVTVCSVKAFFDTSHIKGGSNDFERKWSRKPAKITGFHVFLIKITDKCVMHNRYLLREKCSCIKGLKST